MATQGVVTVLLIALTRLGLQGITMVTLGEPTRLELREAAMEPLIVLTRLGLQGITMVTPGEPTPLEIREAAMEQHAVRIPLERCDVISTMTV